MAKKRTWLSLLPDALAKDAFADKDPRVELMLDAIYYREHFWNDYATKKIMELADILVAETHGEDHAEESD